MYKHRYYNIYGINLYVYIYIYIYIYIYNTTVHTAIYNYYTECEVYFNTCPTIKRVHSSLYILPSFLPKLVTFSCTRTPGGSICVEKHEVHKSQIFLKGPKWKLQRLGMRASMVPRQPGRRLSCWCMKDGSPNVAIS